MKQLNILDFRCPDCRLPATPGQRCLCQHIGMKADERPEHYRESISPLVLTLLIGVAIVAAGFVLISGVGK
jgi:hypothetical protein